MKAVASQASAASVGTITESCSPLLGPFIEVFMLGVHSYGLNWWVSRPLATLLVRGYTIPFLVYELKASSKFELMMPRRKEIKEEMYARGMKPQAVEEGNNKMDEFCKAAEEGSKKMIELCKEYGVDRSDPAAIKMWFIFEAALSYSFIGAMSCMVRNVPSLKTGGTLWFIDLTTADVTGALPFLMLLTLWGKVSFIWNDRQGAKATLAIFLVMVSWILPKATVLCFLTSDVFCLCFGYVLRNSRVKKALGIPEIPVAPAAPPSSAGDKLSRMIRNFLKDVKEGY